jgi:hypothetical protein
MTTPAYPILGGMAASSGLWTSPASLQCGRPVPFAINQRITQGAGNPLALRAGRCSGSGFAYSFVFVSTQLGCPRLSAWGAGFAPTAAPAPWGVLCSRRRRRLRLPEHALWLPNYSPICWDRWGSQGCAQLVCPKCCVDCGQTAPNSRSCCDRLLRSRARFSELFHRTS